MSGENGKDTKDDKWEEPTSPEKIPKPGSKPPATLAEINQHQIQSLGKAVGELQAQNTAIMALLIEMSDAVKHLAVRMDVLTEVITATKP